MGDDMSLDERTIARLERRVAVLEVELREAHAVLTGKGEIAWCMTHDKPETELGKAAVALRAECERLKANALSACRACGLRDSVDPVASLAILAAGLDALTKQQAVELAALRLENERLKEWNDAVSNAVRQCPEFHTGQWAGDKAGWGFHFEVIMWLIRERRKISMAAEASARIRAELDRLRTLAGELAVALEGVRVAHDSLFSQCLSNHITNAWGEQVDVTALNVANEMAGTALAAYRAAMGGK